MIYLLALFILILIGALILVFEIRYANFRNGQTLIPPASPFPPIAGYDEVIKTRMPNGRIKTVINAYSTK